MAQENTVKRPRIARVLTVIASSNLERVGMKTYLTKPEQSNFSNLQ